MNNRAEDQHNNQEYVVYSGSVITTSEQLEDHQTEKSSTMSKCVSSHHPSTIETSREPVPMQTV